MKKIVLFLGVLCLLSSCSDDDENETAVSVDELVGKWTLVTFIDNGIVIDLDDCDKLDALTFTTTTVFSENFFTDDDGECQDDGTQLSNFTVNNNTFTITDPDDATDSTVGEISTSDSSSLQIVFSSEDGQNESRSYIKAVN